MVRLRRETKQVFRQLSNETSAAAGYEWLFKYAGIRVNGDFQKKFSCRRQGFEDVAQKVSEAFKSVNIFVKPVANAKQKFELVKKMIDKDIPCLITLYIGRDRWHIFPVVGYDDNERLLYMIDPSNCEIRLSYDYLEEMQEKNTERLANEISWIEVAGDA